MGAFQYCSTWFELEDKLVACLGKTLGEVDVRDVFAKTKMNPKVTGIDSDVIEQSVIGYPSDSEQEPDLVIDGKETELKTTGLKRSKKDSGFEAKEPMSITAVSLNKISSEEFETSNFWHKAKRMLIVYCLYDSEKTVLAADYADFPIKGYQLHEFDDDEREALKNGWTLVRDYVTPDPFEISRDFGVGKKESPFQNAGCMQDGHVFTCRVKPDFDGPRMTLPDIRVPDSEVPEQFFIDEADLSKWEYQRSAKKKERTTTEGFTYNYTEGVMAWPDPLDSPARTILTGEGGKGASRMKHAIYAENGNIRRLVPDELGQIQMLPKGWTVDEGDGENMTDGHRAFCMRNALVVGIPHAIGVELSGRL